MVHGVTFSPEGNLLAAASWDGSAKVWSVKSHELVQKLGGYGRVHRVLFSPNGKTIAVSETPTGLTDLYDTTSWKKRASFNNGFGVGQMAFSPDGTMIAVAIVAGTAVETAAKAANVSSFTVVVNSANSRQRKLTISTTKM